MLQSHEPIFSLREPDRSNMSSHFESSPRSVSGFHTTAVLFRSSILAGLFLILGFLQPILIGQEKPAEGSDKGAASALQKPYPLDAVVTKDGTVLIVDRNLPGIWKKTDAGLSVFVQGSKRLREPLNACRCLALTADDALIVGDSATRDVYRIDAAGKPEAITGGKIGIPVDLAVSSDGTIYVADLETRSVLKIAAGTKEPTSFAKLNARGISLDATGNLWVVTQDTEQLVKVDASGKAEAIVKERVFNFPHQVSVNAAGEAFVTDGYEKAVWKVAPGKAPEKWFQGEPLVNPVGTTWAGDKLIVVDPRASTLFQFDAEAKISPWIEVR